MPDNSLLGYDPISNSGMSWMPFAGAAAGMAPYLGYSRLPQSTGQALAGAAGGLMRGSLAASQNLLVSQEAQKNQLGNVMLMARLRYLAARHPEMFPNGVPGFSSSENYAPRSETTGDNAPGQNTALASTLPSPSLMTGTLGGQVGQGVRMPQAAASSPASGSLMTGGISGDQLFTPREEDAIFDANLLGVPGNVIAKRILGANETLPYLQSKAQVTSPLAVDLENLKAAQQSGNPTEANAAYTKLLTDSGQLHVANWTGTTTMVGPNGPIYSFNPQNGVSYANGQVGLAPGAYQTAAALANAKGSGEQAGKTAFSPVKTVIPTGPAAGTEVTTLGRNVFPGLGAGGVLMQAPAPGTRGGQAPGVGNTQQQATGQTATGPITELSPSGEEMSKAAGEQAGKNNDSFQTEAELAKDQNAQIDAIRNSAATFGPGKFANVRGEYLNFLNSAGLIGKDDLQKFGSYQEGTKIAIQLQAAATRVLGAREAAQIFTWMGKSMPNLTMSSAGLEKVSSFMQGMNDYKIARAQMAQGRFNQNDAVGVNSVRNDFIGKSNPMFFIMADSSAADRSEYLKNMGPEKAKQFLTSWQAAEQAGYAPGPGGQ